MGRKFIIEEVEEESKFGCGSIVATIIIALVIGLCGGFCYKIQSPIFRPDSLRWTDGSCRCIQKLVR